MASAERWTTAAEALSSSVTSLERHQTALGKQTELLENLMATSRDVADLERSLDANLAALSATGRFEETLAALTAAVHLLSARAMARGRDDMDEARRVGKAA
jgi:exonuclease VII small subunit